MKIGLVLGAAFCLLFASIAFSQGTSIASDCDSALLRGRISFEKGDFTSAIISYGDAIRIDPRRPEAYYSRGVAYTKSREYDKAISDFGEAIRFDPKLAIAYVARGAAYWEKGEYDKDIADCGAAIQLNSSLASAFAGRGIAYRAMGEMESAIKDFADAKRLGYRGAETEGAAGTHLNSVDEADDGRIRAIEEYVVVTRAQKKTMYEVIKEYDKARDDFMARNGARIHAATNALIAAESAKDAQAIAQARQDLLVIGSQLNVNKTRYDLESVLSPAQRRILDEGRWAAWLKIMTDPVQLGDDQLKTVMAKYDALSKENGGEPILKRVLDALPAVLTREQKAWIAKSRARRYVTATFGRIQMDGTQAKKTSVILDDVIKQSRFDADWPEFKAANASLYNGIILLLNPEQLKSVNRDPSRVLSGSLPPFSDKARSGVP